MRTAIAVVLFLHASAVNAGFTDFSDYTQSTQFASGETFSSHGLQFRAVQLTTSPNPARISVNAAQTLQHLQPGAGVDFLLPPGIQEIAFSYVDGAGSLFAINGVQPQYVANRAGFSHFDGTILGGVSIDANVLTQSSDTYNGQFIVSHETGILTLRGPIDSFTLAGLELSIDNVLVRVPEPASCALLAIAAMGIIRRRARR